MVLENLKYFLPDGRIHQSILACGSIQCRGPSKQHGLFAPECSSGRAFSLGCKSAVAGEAVMQSPAGGKIQRKRRQQVHSTCLFTLSVA